MEYSINGIPVKFPFEPYDLQKDYMSKVIECLQNDTHGVLESPTGTGKTLSLLCSSLAWLEVKKAQVQALWHKASFMNDKGEPKGGEINDVFAQLNEIAGASAPNTRGPMGMTMPQIIYSSRTHSQLSQAMQELKRTSYGYMNASVLGSREQMCIHPEVVNEELSSVKINMCRVKVQTRSCHFYNRVERQKDHPAVCSQKVIDIEDLVKLGQTHKFCPYFMSKELKQKADIVFMPYNYLLDPRARKALGIELSNNIVILDEAHNIEKICEDSASLQIKTADIALCIEEVTEVMKAISNDHSQIDFNDSPPDFTADEVCNLKQLFLDFEKVLDGVEIKNAAEGVTFEGDHIFKMLAEAGIRDDNFNSAGGLIERICQFLATVNSGPFQRKGHSLQLFEDLLRITFASIKPDFKDKIRKCYKVHITEEQPQSQKSSNWLAKATAKAGGKILSFWCFSPGFGMNMLMDQGVKCVILTSGTLAPLNPLITELEMNIGVKLENPHIVKGDQVCVKILSRGPDGQMLNCNYQNRSNPAYLRSLGMTINNLSKFIPDGLLIFFPSYPVMKSCMDAWQESELWNSITQHKSIYVEPKQKNAFQEAMVNYYEDINDPSKHGAIFMGVCRGKVSEGLDFADANGRAVLIIGLPYPPLKDPRIVLKKRYLDTCRTINKEYLCGNDWYSLEATKAVNQAIGRVIRHKSDYGAIILLDSRFNNPKVLGQMSMWLRNHVKNVNSYGELIRELRSFYKGAIEKFPVTAKKPMITKPVQAQFDTPQPYKKASNFDFSSSSLSVSSSNSSSAPSSTSQLVTIHKREGDSLINQAKRKRIVIKQSIPEPLTETQKETLTKSDVKDYLLMVKKQLSSEEYTMFLGGIKSYRDDKDFDKLCSTLDGIFMFKMHLSYIILGLQPYIKSEHKELFKDYCNRLSL